MTFRPSVLPDRDNDILSTFTRSFERARQLVRQDQSDRRAQQLHDLEVRERTQAIEDREFQAAMELATTPGLEQRGGARRISPEQAEIASIFGRNAAGEPTAEVRAPTIFGRPAAVPPELMPPPGTPGDVRVLGERGGQQVTFSQMLADRIRRQRLGDEAEFEETLPGPRREREREDELATSVRNLLRADPITDAEGQPIPPEAIPSAEFGRDLIEQQRGERLARDRQVDVRATPTPRTTTGRTPDEIRLGQSRGRILSSFRSRVAAAERTIPAPGSNEERMMRARGEQPPTVDRAQIMRESINEAQAVGDISEAEANEMRQQIPQLLEQAGAGATSTTGAAGDVTGLSDAEITSIVGILRRAGSLTEAEIREDLGAEGLTEDEIQQILDAM